MKRVLQFQKRWSLSKKPDRFFNLSGMTNPVNLPIAHIIGQVR